MASHLHASHSHRTRFSREGFAPIPSDHQSDTTPRDATIDIPLEPVKTNNITNGSGGLRTNDGTAAMHQTYTNGSQPNKGDGQRTKTGFFRGRRTKGGRGTGKMGYDGEEDTITTMGKVYTKVLGFSLITRYILYILPLGILIAIPIIVGASLDHNGSGGPKIGGVPIIWFFSWVEIIWVSLWVSKIVAHFLPYVFQVLVGVVSSGVRKYATVLRKLEIPLSLVGWAVTSLATFSPIMHKNPWNHSHPNAIGTGPNAISSGNWITIVTRLLAAATVSSLVLLGEKFIIQLVSINYHKKQFNSRIMESKRHVYNLTLLYDASRTLFPMYCHEFSEEDYTITDQLQLSAIGGKKHKRTGSATPLRLIHNIGRFGDQVTSAFGNVAQEITGREVFNPNSSHSIVVEALEHKRSSEALARRIWMSLVVEGREALLEEDILDVLGPERQVEAEEAYWALDRDGNGDISLDEMVMAVTEWGRERKAVATSMVDVASAINVLDNLLCTVVLVAVIFIVIAFLNTSFVTTLATAGTALLSLSFVFSVTAQEFLGSCIFLFVKHPFDVGDRVDINGDPLTVEHISLLFSVFRRVSGPKTGQLVQYPNIVLNTLALENVSRSKAMSEAIALDISFATTFDDIQILKNELAKFVTDKENNRDFQPDFQVEVLGTSDMSKLQLKVEIRHKSNWANESLRAARRSKFMCALVAALRAVPIYPPGGGVDAAGSAANPNYGVTITPAEAKENAQSTAQTREDARLVSTKKLQAAKETDSFDQNKSSGQSSMAGLNNHDAKIVNDLNSRDPASSGDDAWASGRDDSSTLGRPSLDLDLNEVRGLLRRESSRGKRKPSTEQTRYQLPLSIPTINEPQPLDDFSTYQVQAPSSQAPPTGYSTTPAPYQPKLRGQPIFQPQQSNVEMSQLNSNNNSYPYRGGRSAGRGKGPTDDDDDLANIRPYSGV